MDNFLGLGLIGVVYGLSVLVDAWGFLAVFFGAVALRQTELKLAGGAAVEPDRPRIDHDHSEAENALPTATRRRPSAADR